MTVGFSVEPEFQERLDWAREFVDAEILPLETLVGRPDIRNRRIAELQDQVKRAGLWAAHLDPEHGGQGYGQLKLGLLQEVLGRSKLGRLVFGCQPPDSGNSEILARHGTRDQKRRFLVPLLDGRIHSAYAMTEPGAGADPTLLSTRAVLDDDGWTITGDKWFITNASVASFFIVMAVTEPDAPPHRRATQFIVEAGRPGLFVEREIGSMENPAPVFGEIDNHAVVRFDGLRVGHDAVLGPRGAGFTIAQERLGPGRIHHVMRWVGQAQRALDMLCERALSRRAHGSLLSDKQTVRNWIADSTAELHALKLMTLHAAAVMDEQGPRAALREIAIIKFWGAEVLHRIVDRALQVHGSLGYSTDMPLESMYREARAARLYDGPDEVHRDTVARLVLRDYASVEGSVPSEHIPTRRRAVLERLGIEELPPSI
jgi:acyl-CoA dehydrogenase